MDLVLRPSTEVTQTAFLISVLITISHAFHPPLSGENF